MSKLMAKVAKAIIGIKDVRASSSDDGFTTDERLLTAIVDYCN